jgi:hypothetical protein
VPTIQVIGAHKLEVSANLFALAMDLKYAGMLSSAQRQLVEQHVRDELAGVVLIELLVLDRDDRFSVGDFAQPGSDQAVYSEVYLSPDGHNVIAEGFDVPESSTFRVAFYLHYVDPTKELKTTYGSVSLPTFTPMPRRLAELVPYEPVT